MEQLPVHATGKSTKGNAASVEAGIRKVDLKDQKRRSHQRRGAYIKAARGLGMGAKQLVENTGKS